MATKLQYYQTDDKVYISFIEKNVDASAVNTEFEPKRLRVTYKDRVLLNTSLYDTAAEIVATNCKNNKIEIILKKETPKQWPHLEDKEKDKQDAKKAPTDKWTSLVRELEEEEAKEEGSAEKLFQNIFKDADDDVKRAMMKSYVESKGTVLSTNWDEISKKKTPIKPPSGMEFKEY